MSVKTDCYFYMETPDMGAMIPCCALKTEFGCLCTDCKKYFPKEIIPEKLLNISDFIIRSIAEQTMFEKEYQLYLDSVYDDAVKMMDDFFSIHHS